MYHRVPAVLLFCMMSSFTAVVSAGAQAPGTDRKIRQVVRGDLTYVVRGDGSVLSWGGDRDGGDPVVGKRVDLPGPVRQMAVGRDATFALLDDGQVLAWGTNDRGQFGRGPGSSRTPQNPLRSTTPIRVPLPDDVVQIAAAGHHGLAVLRDGTVRQWGEQAGTGGAPDATALRPVPGLRNVIKVAAADQHDLALTAEGFVFAWGANNSGQLAQSLETRRNPTPQQVPGLDRVIDIAGAGTTNFSFSGAVRADGSVWMWGSDQSATMGDGSFWANGGPSPEYHETPVQVKGVSGAKTITSGEGHIFVLLADGSVRGWGHDGWGQIGVGTAGSYQPLPKRPALTQLSAVYATANSSFAVRGDGTLWWWGVSLLSSGVRSPLARNQRVPLVLALP
jgi:alpha-tubulin suppressor-like RCC1 family protein